MEGVEPEGGEEEVEAAIVVVPAGRDLLFFLASLASNAGAVPGSRRQVANSNHIQLSDCCSMRLLACAVKC